MSREKLIYIASPYAGDIETNTAFAKKACWYAIHQGHTPIAVHLLYPQMLDDAEPTEREIGLRLGHRVLEVCDELWLCGGRVSSGMAREIEEAQRLGIPIRQIGELEIKQEALPAEMEQSEAAGQSMGMPLCPRWAACSMESEGSHSRRSATASRRCGPARSKPSPSK